MASSVETTDHPTLEDLATIYYWPNGGRTSHAEDEEADVPGEVDGKPILGKSGSWDGRSQTKLTSMVKANSLRLAGGQHRDEAADWKSEDERSKLTKNTTPEDYGLSTEHAHVFDGYFMLKLVTKPNVILTLYPLCL